MSISSLPAAAHQPLGTATPEATPAGTLWSEANAQLLLRQVAAGDTTAFEQLYHHYAPRLATFLRRHLGAAALVDDVVNEVMFVVWQRAAVFQPPGCVDAWLFGIAWKKARKARRQRPQDAPAAPSTRECGSSQDTPEQLCCQWEQHRLVIRALERLPPEQRAVVELTYYHICSAREIAQRLEEAEATVRSRLRLARQRLAHCLARQGLVPPTPPGAAGIRVPSATISPQRLP
jgi:RNA polymerase sigma-70 factor (ECF subfamily)